MSTLGTVAIVGGLGALGIGAYVLIRRQGLVAATPAAAAARPPAAAPKSAITQLANGATAVSKAGCQTAAGALHLPSSLSGSACGAFNKYLTPLGVTGVALTAAAKIPIVGPAVKAAESVANKVVSVPYNAVKSVLGKIF